MNRTSKHLVTAASLVAAVGLSSNAAGSPFTTIDPSGSAFGKAFVLFTSLAGKDLNGTSLNGDALEGHHVEWIRATEGSYFGTTIERIDLERGRLDARREKGKKLRGEDLAGALLAGVLDDGMPLELFVADVERRAEWENRDVYDYELWYETVEGWEPLCGLDAWGDPVRATPLAGRWRYEAGVPGGGAHIDDPDAFTFACHGHVLAKCVLAGYKPWKKTLTCRQGAGCEIGTLADHHQACTRALRADYLGDGTSHTVDGTLVNLYDGYGVRYDVESWPVEAEWDADGAICTGATTRTESLVTAPLFASDCGDVSYFTDGTLLVTELPAVPLAP